MITLRKKKVQPALEPFLFFGLLNLRSVYLFHLFSETTLSFELVTFGGASINKSASFGFTACSCGAGSRVETAILTEHASFIEDALFIETLSSSNALFFSGVPPLSEGSS